MDLWSSILCPKLELLVFHKRECLLGECPNCGVQTSKTCPSKLISKRLVMWHKISYVVGQTSEGCDKKVSKVEYYETKPRELINYLNPNYKNL